MKTIKIKTSDHLQLSASYFEADFPSNKIVLISPATGVKKHIYNQFAEYLSQHGFDVLTWDWRGVADNLVGDLKDDNSIMEDWAKKDLHGMINWASVHLPTHQIFAVGHSFGGQGLGMAANIDKVQSIITIATQSGYWRHWPIKQRYKFAAIWYGVIPFLSHTLGFFPSKKLGLGENLPKGVALQWASWGRNPQYMADYAGHEKMTQKILAYYFTDDSFAPKAAVKVIHQHYNHCQVNYREVSPSDLNTDYIGHFGYFTKKESQKLWSEAIDFFNS